MSKKTAIGEWLRHAKPGDRLIVPGKRNADRAIGATACRQGVSLRYERVLVLHGNHAAPKVERAFIITIAAKTAGGTA